MPDADYIINLQSGAGNAFCRIAGTTASGFDVDVYKLSGGTGAVNVNWQAFKLITDTSYTAMQTAVDEALPPLSALDTSSPKAVNSQAVAGYFARKEGDLALASGVSLDSGSFAYLEQSGNVCSLHFHGLRVTPLGASDWTLLGTVPSTIGKPKKDFLFSTINSQSGGQSILQMNTNGELYVYSPSVTTEQNIFACSVSYITG